MMGLMTVHPLCPLTPFCWSLELVEVLPYYWLIEVAMEAVLEA
jgi:hypothetical protein